MMSLVGLYALLKTPLRAITIWRVLTLMTATIITNYNMKLLDIFKRKKNAELECLRDAYNYSQPRTYATTAYHNFELERLLNILKTIDLKDEA